MIDQGAIPVRFAGRQSLLHPIEHEVGPHRAAYSSADDIARVDVDDEGNVDHALPGRDGGEVANPELGGTIRPKLQVHAIQQAPRVGLGLAHPAPQRLGGATDLLGNRLNGRPLRLVLALRVQNHAHGALHNLEGKLQGRPIAPSSIEGASTIPGASQGEKGGQCGVAADVLT